MNDLLNKKCVPCEGGVLPFDLSEIHKYQKKVDRWNISKDEKKFFFLNKKFNFKNFLDSQNFINKVGEISENEGHHPDISNGKTPPSQGAHFLFKRSFISKFGAGKGGRTLDLLVGNETLYH